MKIMKFIFAGLAFATLVNCTGGQKKADAQQTETTVETPTKAETGFTGTYEGTLPCADCPGIKTVLTINEDTTYDLRSEYLEKENGVFEQNGTYSLVHNGEVIELFTPSSGEKIYYRILDGAVALTAEDGILNEGELAEHYILKKK